MLNFAEWLKQLEEGDRSGAKYGIYPPGYDGQGLYPLQVFITKAADAITYMSNPKLASNDGPPFSILHVDKDGFGPGGAVRYHEPPNVSKAGIVKPGNVDSKGIVKPKSVSSSGIVKPGNVDSKGIVKPRNVAKLKRHSFGDETLPG